MSERLTPDERKYLRQQVGWMASVDMHRCLDDIDALESENAELRRKVKAAEALADAVDAYVEADSLAADRHDTRPYVTVGELMDMGYALDAYRRATATDEGG